MNDRNETGTPDQEVPAHNDHAPDEHDQDQDSARELDDKYTEEIDRQVGKLRERFLRDHERADYIEAKCSEFRAQLEVTAREVEMAERVEVEAKEYRAELATAVAEDIMGLDEYDVPTLANQLEGAFRSYGQKVERVAFTERDHPRYQEDMRRKIERELRPEIEREIESREFWRKTKTRRAVHGAAWTDEVMRALVDVKAILSVADTPTTPEPLFIAGRDLLGQTFPPTPWLVEGLIKEGGLGVVGAEPKCGKTWTLTEIAMAVATGTPAFREFKTGPARQVAYYYAEDTGHDVQSHLRALAAGRNMDPARAVENLHLQPRGRFLDLVNEVDVAMIVASCRRIGPIDLLCIDPLRDVHSADEDNSGEMSNVMRRLRVIGQLVGCTVIVPHHDKKGGSGRGGQKMRGSSAVHGAVDSGLYLSGLNYESGATVTIANKVESEIKGARSAGTFGLVLRLVDDEHGHARLATWRVERENAQDDADRERDQDVKDDAAVMVKVRELAEKGLSKTKSDLREVVRDLDAPQRCVPQKRASRAIDRLIATGHLTIAKRQIVLV